MWRMRLHCIWDVATRQVAMLEIDCGSETSRWRGAIDSGSSDQILTADSLDSGTNSGQQLLNKIPFEEEGGTATQVPYSHWLLLPLLTLPAS